MTETITPSESLLGFVKAGVLLINPGLVKLLTAPQDVFVRLGGVDEDRPFARAEDELVDGRAAMKLPLSGAPPAKEAFQIVVRAPACGPGITREEPGPALGKGCAAMDDHRGILGVGLRVRLHLGQALLDLALDSPAGRAPLPLVLRGSEPPVQFHQPVALALAVPIVWRNRLAEGDHRQPLRQDGRAPF
jgi:hypothetical protein